MKLKNITVATEKYGYYIIMEESCKRHNIELITLGMGQKWEGFTMRFKLWLNYLNKLDDNEIVMINDAYDVIMLEDAEDIIKKFKSFDKKIIFSAQDSILSKILFPICNLEKKVICAGNMIGYVKYLKKLINLLFEKKSLWKKFNKDDQVVINHLCNVEKQFFKEYITIDKERKIFLALEGEYYFYNLLFGSLPQIKMKNQKLFTYNNIKPSVLHLTGHINGDKYLKYLGYDIKNNSGLFKTNDFYRFSAIKNNLKNVLLLHRYTIIISILCIYIFIKNFKINSKNITSFIIGMSAYFGEKIIILPLILILILNLLFGNLLVFYKQFKK